MERCDGDCNEACAGTPGPRGPQGIQGIPGPIGPAGPLSSVIHDLKVATGDRATLSGTLALLQFGGDQPQVIVPADGTYHVYAGATIVLNGVTTTGLNRVLAKIRRLNNAPVDLGQEREYLEQIQPTNTWANILGSFSLVPQIVELKAGDLLGIYASLTNFGNISVGNIQVSNCYLGITKLAN